MPISIKSLPVLRFDYTNRGPGLHMGLMQLGAMLDTEGGREGYVVVNVAVAGAVIPIVLARSDLYVMGFRCAERAGHSRTPSQDSGTKDSIGASAVFQAASRWVQLPASHNSRALLTGLNGKRRCGRCSWSYPSAPG